VGTFTLYLCPGYAHTWKRRVSQIDAFWAGGSNGKKNLQEVSWAAPCYPRKRQSGKRLSENKMARENLRERKIQNRESHRLGQCSHLAYKNQLKKKKVHNSNETEKFSPGISMPTPVPA